ncbi:hypothetical protein ACFWY9_30535 [Amycolatopsis sp. NPDC059027]|uniref:hypothetical protein n=1 Tax=Amycolatopsis sp. NPDC059027 TaxID=3346709 RepID=UPI003671A455
MAGKNVAKKTVSINELTDVKSWDDALTFLQGEGIDVVSASDVEEFLGDGFTYVEKNALINIPFVILQVNRIMSPSYDVPMTTIRAMTATDKKVKFVDFSTGVNEEITSFEERSGRSAVGLVVKRGLRVSEYDVCDECKRAQCTEHPDAKQIKASTFYLNMEE